MSEERTAPAAHVLGGRSLERRPRRALAIGGALLVSGLGMVGVGASDVGQVLTLGALVTLIYGIHTFGRLGPD